MRSIPVFPSEQSVQRAIKISLGETFPSDKLQGHELIQWFATTAFRLETVRLAKSEHQCSSLEARRHNSFCQVPQPVTWLALTSALQPGPSNGCWGFWKYRLSEP